MSKKRSSLGKGLGALLGAAHRLEERIEPLGFPNDRESDRWVSSASTSSGFLELSVNHLSPGRFQPRRIMHQADLESLADSIRAQGMIQPILVQKTDQSDQYEIIAGERRWRAAQLAGLSVVPVVLKEVSDEQAMAIALIENIQRENLSALEEAAALDRLSKEFGLTHQQVSEAVGKSRATISNLLRLLTLTPEVKKLLEANDLEMGHAKVLLSLKGTAQEEAAQSIVQKGLSVRETEALVSRMLDAVADSAGESKARRATARPAKDPDVQRLEKSLSEKLGAVVEIIHGTNGKGRLSIAYHSLEELEGILAHIQ